MPVAEVLAALADDKRRRTAEKHPDCPPELLAKLERHEAWKLSKRVFEARKSGERVWTPPPLQPDPEKAPSVDDQIECERFLAGADDATDWSEVRAGVLGTVRCPGDTPMPVHYHLLFRDIDVDDLFGDDYPHGRPLTAADDAAFEQWLGREPA